MNGQQQQMAPQMTPEQAILFYEQQMEANDSMNGHHGPKSVFVMAQVASQTLRRAISPAPAPPEPPPNEMMA